MTTRVDLAKALVTQRCRLEARLRELGEPIPAKQPWDDEVTYVNSLLEAVEVAEEEQC
jgi:hypothetical protein